MDVRSSPHSFACALVFFFFLLRHRERVVPCPFTSSISRSFSKRISQQINHLKRYNSLSTGAGVAVEGHDCKHNIL